MASSFWGCWESAWLLGDVAWKKNGDGVLVFCFLLLWKWLEESNLEEKGFIAAHSSRLHISVVGKLSDA